MRAVVMRFPIRQWLLPIGIVCATFGPANHVWAVGDPKQVLVLHSARRDAVLAETGDREISRILKEGLPDGVDVYPEYIDTARFSNPQYGAVFRDFIRSKYKDQQFGVVIALECMSLDFVERIRDELFPETPIVFFALTHRIRRIGNSTGVFAEPNFTRTLELATALQPGVQQVFVVSGASVRDRFYESVARTQFESFGRGLTFTYLSGLPTNELERRVATLPRESIVYYVIVSQDGAGTNYLPIEYLDNLAAAASVPVYSWQGSTMGHGIVGGSMVHPEIAIGVVGSQALRVLRGEPADSIPTSAPDESASQVDWRQIRRWRISESRLPAGTTITFRELTIWDRHKLSILVAVTLLFALFTLVGGLLLQASRRRRAEEQIRKSQTQLRASYERIRDLGGRLLTAQEAERSRIARELHDDVGQQATLLTMDLERLSRLGLGLETDADRLVRETLDLAKGVATSVRDLSHRLHPASLRLIGLVPALRDLQEDWQRPGLAITFSHENVPAQLPEEITLCLFRIAQEALQNTAKHSEAHNVSMRLVGGEDGLAFTIVDDGVGFDVNAVLNKGLGLISMGERLRSIGGTLKISSEPGAGARLEISVPLDVAPPV